MRLGELPLEGWRSKPAVRFGNSYQIPLVFGLQETLRREINVRAISVTSGSASSVFRISEE